MSFNRYPSRTASERPGPAVCCPSCGHVLLRLEAGAFATPPPGQPASSPGSALLRVNEAAEELAISRTKLYQLIAAREVNVIRIGKSVRVPRHEIDRLAQGAGNAR